MTDNLSGALGRVDFEGALDRAKERATIEYRNPMEEPWGDPSRSTRSQKIAWRILEESGKDQPFVGILGAKGSGKTYLGACFALARSQQYPESLGCLIANTYQQAKDVISDFIEVAKNLDLSVEYFKSKKIHGREYGSLYVVDLDGSGFDTGKNSYLLMRSFDAVDKLEGIELDWLWCEEVQDAEKDQFITVMSRVRGQRGDAAVYVAGMPRSEFHWQYSLLPQIGFIEEESYDAEEHRGILLEPSVRENLHNVRDGYLDYLRSMYGEEQAKWYIEGKRTSLNTNKLLYNYSDHVHRKGRMAQVLSEYDPKREIIVSFDFNVSPMSASLWQIKEWNDKWDGDNVKIVDEGVHVYDTAVDAQDPDAEYAEFDSLRDYCEPERKVAAQIDEFEVWQGGTAGTCEEIVEKYEDHVAGITIVGDATGNRRDTRSAKTDWQIIRRTFSKLPEVAVIQGLEQNYNYKTGEVKYSNPSRRDTVNVANKLLRDAEGRVHVCFLPKSRYKSGGVAKSVAMAKTKPDGNIDTSNDRKEGRDVPRLHFFDTFRYFCWWYHGGIDDLSPEEFDKAARELEHSAHLSEMQSSNSAFGF